jgi:hypothetical protein
MADDLFAKGYSTDPEKPKKVDALCDKSRMVKSFEIRQKEATRFPLKIGHRRRENGEKTSSN